MRGRRVLCAGAAIVLSVSIWGHGRFPAGRKRMSFHNRILLNRAAVSGLDRIQVMLAVREGAFEAVSSRVRAIGGRVVRAYAAVGYARVEVPLDTLVGFVDDDRIEAYQISTRSRAGWYRDGEPERDAEGYRGFERTPVRGVDLTPVKLELPPLPAERSREPGYTADDDAGVGAWLKEHPTYDGRGVTIAILETATPEFSHPVFAPVRSLEGTPVPKLAGVLNTIDSEDPDDTRVALETTIHSTGTWARAGDRTYILPRPGTFRFGSFTLPAAPNLVHRFGVLEDPATREIWVDTDGDTDFGSEKPIADVNARFDIRRLTLTHPVPTTLAFVVGRGRAPGTVHLYVARGDHQTMTVSVAAGSRTDDGLAYGVAPGARVLLVRNHTTGNPLHTLIEGYIEAAARPDVDVLTDASGIAMGPDTAADFTGLLFSRIVAVYGKPIFHGAGNMHLFINTVSALGGVFSVGGSMGARTFSALYGGGPVAELTVHHVSAGGPSVDGLIKPDFLAPMNRIAAGLPSLGPRVQVPKNAPAYQLPAGYWISCCTSASGPYGGGVGALLVSAARQKRLNYSLERFSWALRSTAKFLPRFGAHQQGNGMLDIRAAWDALKRSGELPAIRSTARIVHPLAPYAARGDEGFGIFEHGGWRAGMTAVREVSLRRDSGPDGPVRYRVAWTGNDGTFSAPPTVALPLHADTTLPISISVQRHGAHSAILDLHDPGTDALVFRMPVTILAPEDVDPHTHAIRFAGVLRLMEKTAHYLHVPPHVEALHVELQIVRGSVSATMIPGNSLVPLSNSQVFPQMSRTLPKGTYVALLPRPVSGTWTFDLANIAAVRERDPALVTTGDAEYRLTVRLLRSWLSVASSGGTPPRVDVKNSGAQLREPEVRTSPGAVESHGGRVRGDGLPNTFDVLVPTGATTLRLDLRTGTTMGMELYLYDCTSGECFFHDYTMPASHEQRVVVRKPEAGRWIAAVNAAPFPAEAAEFTLDVIVTTIGAVPVRESSGATPILLHELFDRALLRDEETYRWETRDTYPPLPNSPVAVGSVVQTLAPGARRGKGRVR